MMDYMLGLKVFEKLLDPAYIGNSLSNTKIRSRTFESTSKRHGKDMLMRSHLGFMSLKLFCYSWTGLVILEYI